MKKVFCKTCKHFWELKKFSDNLNPKHKQCTINRKAYDLSCCCHEDNLQKSLSWYSETYDTKQHPSVLNENNDCKLYENNTACGD